MRNQERLLLRLEWSSVLQRTQAPRTKSLFASFSSEKEDSSLSVFFASLLQGGGPGRNRTGIRGFAVLCITTLPPDLIFYPGWQTAFER